MAMPPKLKNKLSAAVVGLILAGASAPVILDQFLDEKEGNSEQAYRDGGGLWTICRGATLVDGKPVVQGMKLSDPGMIIGGMLIITAVSLVFTLGMDLLTRKLCPWQREIENL